jgi:hypothetical protein
VWAIGEDEQNNNLKYFTGFISNLVAIETFVTSFGNKKSQSIIKKTQKTRLKNIL